MKKIELYLNIIHYSIYVFHCKLNRVLDYIDPIRLMSNFQFFKRLERKRGISYSDLSKQITENVHFGMNIQASGGIIVVLLILFVFILDVFISFIFINDVILNIYHLPFWLIPPIFLSYQLVFKEDKYLNYFKKFEKWPKKEKNSHLLKSFLLIISLILLFFNSWRFIKSVVY